MKRPQDDGSIEVLDASPQGSPSFQNENKLELEAANLGGGLADGSIDQQKEMTESTAAGDTPATTKESAQVSAEEEARAKLFKELESQYVDAAAAGHEAAIGQDKMSPEMQPPMSSPGVPSQEVPAIFGQETTAAFTSDLPV